jgi:hypothetical protein
MDRWMCGQELIEGRRTGWMDEWTEEWMDGRRDGWMDGRTEDLDG